MMMKQIKRHKAVTSDVLTYLLFADLQTYLLTFLL